MGLVTLAIKDANNVTQNLRTYQNADNSLSSVGAVQENSNATFRYSFSSSAPPATPTDFITIQGSASKTLRIKRIFLTGEAGTAGTLPVTIIRRSAANTGGTSGIIPPAKHDTSDAAATSTVLIYSINATTLGTLVSGILDAGRLQLPLAGGVGQSVEFNYAVRNDKPLIVRGISDFICISFGGAALPASAVIDGTIEIEEDNS